jgi:hypothetical protein
MAKLPTPKAAKVIAHTIDPVMSFTELAKAPLFVCAPAVDVDVAVVVFVLVPLVEVDEVDVVVEVVVEESVVVVVGTITNVCPLLVLRLRLAVVVVTREVLSPYRQPDIPRIFPQALS